MEKNIDSLHWEHLKDSKLYIQTWIYNSNWMKIPISYIINDADYIDYYVNNKNIAKNNLKWFVENWFSISKINSNNKYSKRYLNCTWIIAVWKSKEDWTNISFLTHQNTLKYLKDKNIDLIFKNNLIKSLEELIKLSEDWSIDIILAWWNDDKKDYGDTIKFLWEIINDLLWFYPSVILWKSDKEKDIVLNTKDRKVYYFKEYSNISENINFISNEVDNLIK